jgi:hypothetical protein
MQTDSAMRFLFALNPQQIVKAFMNPAALVGAMPKIWNSETIQRRLAGGMNAEMQFAFRRAATKPGFGAWVTYTSMRPIAFMDAVFSTIGSAAVYKTAYDEVIAGGGTAELAEKQAAEALDMAIYRYSQPTGFGSKTLTQNSGAMFTRMYMLFLSDAQLKTGIMLDATQGLISGRGDVKTHLKNIVTIEAMALVSHLIAQSYRDAFTDDDDEEIWALGGWVKAALLAPFQGLFFLGAVTDSLLSYFTQQHFFTPSRDPLIESVERLKSVARNYEDTLAFDDPQAMFKQWERLARAAAVSPVAAAPAAALNLAKPAIMYFTQEEEP